MKTSQGKSVSISTETPPSENGPCSVAEEEIDEGSVHEVAVKVVENVVRLASQAAQEVSSKEYPPEEEDTPKQQTATQSRGPCLQRLPTFQIDTVPSMPPSPTDWSPSADDVLFELNEPVDESEIEIQISCPSEEAEERGEVKKFAYSYIQDLIEKAMTVAGKRLESEEGAEALVIAAQIVEDVITKATEVVSERIQRSPVVTIAPTPLEYPGVPEIHIDVAPSMPPSPTESLEHVNGDQQAQAEIKRALPRIRLRIRHEDEDEKKDTQEKEESKKTLIKYAQAPEEIKEIASSYVKDVISKAISMAEEKFVPTVPFSFDDVDLMKTSGPWYIRAREALMRLLRTACFCTPRRNDS